MDEKRLIIAVALSVFILVLFQSITRKNTTGNVYQKTNAVDIQSTQEGGSPDLKKVPETLPAETYSYNEEETLQIEDKNILLNVSSYGGGLKQIKIKDKNGDMINLVKTEKPPYPAALEIPGKMKLERSNGKIKAYGIINGAQIERTYTITNENLIEIKNTITNKDNDVKIIEFEQGWYGGIESTDDLKKENYVDNRPFMKFNGKARNKLQKGIYEGDIEWAGVVNRYFLAAYIDIDKIFENIKITGKVQSGRGCSVTKGSGGEFPSISIRAKVKINPRSAAAVDQKIYCGLKEYTELKKLENGMENILTFGIFGFLSRLFLNILVTFHDFTGNYGVAIILLTIVLQIFIFPLTIKSFKSMMAMKDLQPKISELRTKLKDDPQRMNQEMLLLYKRHKVNPFSGCLPLLLQMPIFISLFTMLRGAAELRYAHFLWITDLAKADVLFSTIPVFSKIPFIGSGGPLPILMGGAMFLQQKLTGGTDGPQKSLTYMMPIMFTFLFMKFPSGLVLYWLSNSILTFIVQYTLSKKNK